MSADNWRRCPKCLKAAEHKRDEVIKELRDAYGIVTAEEYRKLEKAARVDLVAKTGEHFREDYEIGTDESGQFYVSYSGHCEKCDYGHNFSIKKHIP